MSVKLVKETVKQQFLQEIDKQCQKLCVQNRGTPSVLNVKETSSSDALMNSSWEKVMIEMRDCAPDVLDVITTICKLPSVTDVPAVYMTYPMQNFSWDPTRDPRWDPNVGFWNGILPGIPGGISDRKGINPTI